jgi:hypothetical protein
MWAGSQFEFRSPIRIGDRVARTSTIDDVSIKEGRTGRLVVRHEVLQRCRRMIQRGRESDRRGGVDRVFEALATTDPRSELVLQYVHVASCLLDGSSHGGKSPTRRALRELQCFVVLMRRKQ